MRGRFKDMVKRKFTTEFKAQLVLEVLREERELSKIAAEHEVSPNQIRNWKKAFLENAPMLFEESKQEREAKRKEKESAEEKAAMLKTIGQLTMERDFLKEQVLIHKDRGKYL